MRGIGRATGRHNERVAEQERSDRSRRNGSERRSDTPKGRPERKRPLQHRGSRQPPEAAHRTRRPPHSGPPGLTPRENEPPIPEGVDSRSLHGSVRAELRGLPKDLAEIVAAHLVVAGQLVDEDPELAYAHAEAARRRAARLPIVREAAAETAYAAGRYDVALSEFRALRRMTGTQDFLPVMADCERALGRPHNALKLAREADRAGLEPALRVEMIIVEAGARRDLGQDHEARRILERAVAVVRPGRVPPLAVARLYYAYADALLQADQDSDARQWFSDAVKLDLDQETDAQQRIEELDGLLIDYDEDDDEDAQPPEPSQQGGPNERI
jgi:tetratricopeptide (TPR) repeat protein